MNNNQLLRKMKQDMKLRNFSKYTYDSYLGKTKDTMRYFGEKQLEDVTTEELSTFFNAVDNYKFKTIFMLAYGTGLRIGEIANLRVEDIDSKKMRLFVREGKGNKERYTLLPEQSLEMLRTYWGKSTTGDGFVLVKIFSDGISTH